MSASAITGNLASSYLQEVAGTTTGQSAQASRPAAPSDSTRLSPIGQRAGTLQQLQQSDPAKYKRVTEQVATNLQSAAQTAQSQGNTSAANQLSRLSTDFTTASQTGQLPNLQDLGQAVQGGGGQHHRYAQASGPQGGSTDAGAIILQTLANAGINASNS